MSALDHPATFPHLSLLVGTTCCRLDFEVMGDAREIVPGAAVFVLHPDQRDDLVDAIDREPARARLSTADQPREQWCGIPIVVDARVPRINGGHDYCGALLGRHGEGVAIVSSVE